MSKEDNRSAPDGATPTAPDGWRLRRTTNGVVMTAPTVTDSILDRYRGWSRAKDTDRGMVGGSSGRRFMTNGHWMVAISETDYTSALAKDWRNVTETDHWGLILAMGHGRRAETAKIPSLTALAQDGAVDIGSIGVSPDYLEILRELGIADVLIIHDDPMCFAVAPAVAIVSGVRR